MRKKWWWVTILVLSIIIMIGLSASARLVVISSKVEEPIVSSGFRAKVGLFVPTDKNVSDTYGSGLIFGADCLYLFPYKSYGIAGGVDYFYKSRFDGSIKRDRSVIPITGSFLYFFTEEKDLYFGAGVGYYSVRETKEIAGTTISESESGMGFHVVGGYNHRNLFGEIKISSAPMDSGNAGGVSLMIGISF